MPEVGEADRLPGAVLLVASGALGGAAGLAAMAIPSDNPDGCCSLSAQAVRAIGGQRPSIWLPGGRWP